MVVLRRVPYNLQSPYIWQHIIITRCRTVKPTLSAYNLAGRDALWLLGISAASEYWIAWIAECT